MIECHQVETMMSVIETPWHKLGKILQAPPTTQEAIVAAGLDWRAEKQPLQLADGRAVKGGAIVRSTDGRILADYVGPQYTPLQNAEAFSFFDPFLEANQATIETAGALRNGAVVWVLARIGKASDVIVPKADDRVVRYMLLSNSHDGSTSVRAGFTPIRVVCRNTLSSAHQGGASSFLRFRHTKSVKANVDAVRDVMDLANASFTSTANQYRKLASRQINRAQLVSYVNDVFDVPPPPVAAKPAVNGRSILDSMLEEHDLVSDVMSGSFSRGDRAAANAAARLDTIESLFVSGRGNDLPGVKHTAWAAYNAVTEYLQYEKPRSTAETRLDSLAFGSAAVTSRKALDRALAMVAL